MRNPSLSGYQAKQKKNTNIHYPKLESLYETRTRNPMASLFMLRFQFSVFSGCYSRAHVHAYDHAHAHARDGVPPPRHHPRAPGWLG